MQISEKDRKMLIVLAIIIIGLLLYSFLYKPLTKEEEKLSKETSKLENKYNELLIKMKGKDKLEEKIKADKYKISMIDKLLPQNVAQERIIWILKDLQEKTKLKFRNVSFNEVSQLNEFNNKDSVKKENVEHAVGLKMSATITYEGDYEQLKSFLDYINQYPNKITIDNITISNNMQKDILNGSLAISFYAMQLSTREDKSVDLNNIDNGNNYPFEPFDDYKALMNYKGAKGSDKYVYTPKKLNDFMLVVSPVSSDLPSVVMGKTGDKEGKSYVYADNEKFEDIELHIIQENDKYYYKYKTSKESMPKNYSNGRITFNPQNNKLMFNILSNKRNNDEDKNGVNITVINDSDLPVIILVNGDDQKRPRVKVVKTVGKVRVE